MINKDQFIELFGGDSSPFVVKPTELLPLIDNTISDKEIIKIEKQAKKIGGQLLQDFVTSKFVGEQYSECKNEYRFWIPCKSIDTLYDAYLKYIGMSPKKAV